jgi:hypothetical protein
MLVNCGAKYIFEVYFTDDGHLCDIRTFYVTHALKQISHSSSLVCNNTRSICVGIPQDNMPRPEKDFKHILTHRNLYNKTGRHKAELCIMNTSISAWYIMRQTLRKAYGEYSLTLSAFIQLYYITTVCGCPDLANI